MKPECHPDEEGKEAKGRTISSEENHDGDASTPGTVQRADDDGGNGGDEVRRNEKSGRGKKLLTDLIRSGANGSAAKATTSAEEESKEPSPPSSSSSATKKPREGGGRSAPLSVATSSERGGAGSGGAPHSSSSSSSAARRRMRQRAMARAATKRVAGDDAADGPPGRVVASSAGGVEPQTCTHPSFVFGMCAVCGTSQREVLLRAGGGQRGGSTTGELLLGKGAATSSSGGGANRGGGGGGGGGAGILGSLVRANQAQSDRTSARLDGGGGDNHRQAAEVEVEELSHLTVGGETIRISPTEAANMASQSRRRLREARKLSLVLDLDHTLVHATADPRAATEAADRDDVRVALLPAAPGSGAPPGSTLRHYIKLRPHVKEFLLGAMERCEISIYTAGTRAYALQVAHVMCRYIVGAKADEEELNHMRSRLATLSRKAEQTKKWEEEHHESSTVATEEKAKAACDANGKDDLHGPGISHAKVSDAANRKRKGREGDDNLDLSRDTKRLTLENLSERGEKNEACVCEEEKKNARDYDGESSRPKRVTFGPLPSNGASGDQSSTHEDPSDSTTTKKVDAAQAGSIDEKEGKEDIGATVVDLKEKLKEAERLESMASDLSKKMFGSRIVSRTDVGDLGRDVKSLKRVFPCGGMMTAIVDDREDVWANASDNVSGRRPGEPPVNLLLVRPYHWDCFLGYADVNNKSGDDLTESLSAEEKQNNLDKETNAKKGKDEADEIQLQLTSNIIKRLHERYYSLVSSRDDITVPDVLEMMKKEVLSGCKIVLSGLVPLNHQARGINDMSKPRPAVVRYAEDLGAVVVPDVGSDVTHVVAARDGTDKVNKGRCIRGCAVVKVSWLMGCYWSCTFRDVTPHLWVPIRLQDTVPIEKKEDKKTTKILLDSSDDDESFTAEFEQDILGGD